MSMGPDVFLTHIRNALDGDDVAALRVMALGTVSPIVDTFTSEVLGFRFEMVARRHAEARKPTVQPPTVVTGYARGDA